LIGSINPLLLQLKQNYDEKFNKNIFITYEVTWNGKNDSGVQVASGTYVYGIDGGNPSSSSGQSFNQVRKMILIK